MDTTPHENRVVYACTREALDEIHIECRFEDGQKYAPIIVDEDLPQLAQRIAAYLSRDSTHDPGWVSIKNALPTPTVPVLVAYDTGGVGMSYLLQERDRTVYWDHPVMWHGELDELTEYDSIDSWVIAWAPLPIFPHKL